MLRKFWTNISYAGVNDGDNSFDSKRQIIFNQLNFLAIASCIIRLGFMGITSTRDFSLLSFISCVIPIAVCGLIGFLNAAGRYVAAKMTAFFVLPACIGFTAFEQQDYGLSIFPLILCILAFFFLRRRRMIIASFLASGVWFVVLQFSGLLQNDREHFFSDLPLIIFNHVLELSLVFLVLNFIRQVVNSYQQRLSLRNRELADKNAWLLAQQEEILNKTRLLEERQAMLEAANRQKNKMLSVIAHDLRTPVMSVRSLLDLHVRGVMKDEELVHYSPEISREMGNVTDLLENLLSWSRQQGSQEAKQDNIDLEPLVNEIVGLYKFTAGSKSVNLVADVAGALSVTADRQMIKTVLRNLVSNAVKFSPPGGKVVIGASVTDEGVLISVIDEGLGIPEENLKRILEGGEVTTKGTSGEYGSGLGLALCREFLHKNGSTLHINSIPGAGSTFYFALAGTGSTAANTALAVNGNVLKPVMASRPAPLQRV